MIDNLTTAVYRDKCKESWKCLIVLLQFWMDNNAMICIRGGSCPAYVSIGQTGERHSEPHPAFGLPNLMETHWPADTLVLVSGLMAVTIRHSRVP